MAKSVKILCDALNIWCVIAISEANPEKNVKYRHAWNIVKVGGKFYHIDTTFDNGLCRETDDIRYDYFCLPDKQIFRDHEALVWPMPKCEDGDNFYYKVKKLSWTKEEEVRKRCAQAVKKGKILTFHWRGDYLTRERLRDFLHIFEEEAAKVGLEMVPFDAGFFASIPCDNPDEVCAKLEQEGIFLVPLAMGIRVSVASVSEEKCRMIPARIVAAMK